MTESLTKKIFIYIGLACLFGITIIVTGLSSYGIYVSNKMPDVHKHKCKEHNCTVTVIRTDCLAKFVELPDYSAVYVTCDKPRNGFYQVILPCNKDSEGDPIINCDTENIAKVNIFLPSLIGLILSGASFFYMFVIFTVCVLGGNKRDTDGYQKLIDKNNLANNNPIYSVNNPQSETAHYDLDETNYKINDDFYQKHI